MISVVLLKNQDKVHQCDECEERKLYLLHISLGEPLNELFLCKTCSKELQIRIEDKTTELDTLFDEQTQRNICSKTRSYISTIKGNWIHPDAVSCEGPSDYYACFKCPNCNLKFKIELSE